MMSTTWGLDFLNQRSQNTANFNKMGSFLETRKSAKLMTPSHPAQPAKQKVSPEQCKHPQVQIVSRDEDSEYVECKECGDVFESSEFRDMEIEQKKSLDEE